MVDNSSDNSHRLDLPYYPQYVGESNDLGIVNWKRIRLAIEHENILLNNRMCWLITSQGLLLTASSIIFTLLLKDPGKFRFLTDQLVVSIVSSTLMVIPVIAISVAVHISKGIEAAENQHNALQNWWIQWGQFTSSTQHPPICGDDPVFLKKKVPYHKLTWIFILLWICILCVACYLIFFYKHQNTPSNYCKPYLSVYICHELTK